MEHLTSIKKHNILLLKMWLKSPERKRLSSESQETGVGKRLFLAETEATNTINARHVHYVQAMNHLALFRSKYHF